MTTDRVSKVAIIVLCFIIILKWVGGGAPLDAPAQAQIADPARDRQQLLDEVKLTNAKLDKLIDLLRSGETQVKVVQPQPARVPAQP